MELMKKRREERNLTQEKLAEIIKVDRTTITKIEKGVTPSVKTAKAIAKILEFDWTMFFGESEKTTA